MSERQRIRSFYAGQVTTVDLFITDCASCGVIFGFATELEERRRADRATWYCPNGHKMG